MLHSHPLRSTHQSSPGWYCRINNVLRKPATRASHSRAMLDRFRLLDRKYMKKIERPGALYEGVAYFALLDATTGPDSLNSVRLLRHRLWGLDIEFGS